MTPFCHGTCLQFSNHGATLVRGYKQFNNNDNDSSDNDNNDNDRVFLMRLCVFLLISLSFSYKIKSFQKAFCALIFT